MRGYFYCVAVRPRLGAEDQDRLGPLDWPRRRLFFGESQNFVYRLLRALCSLCDGCSTGKPFDSEFCFKSHSVAGKTLYADCLKSPQFHVSLARRDCYS